MDLTVSRAQLEAVRGAKHLPDVLQRVLEAAVPRGEGYVLEGHRARMAGS